MSRQLTIVNPEWTRQAKECYDRHCICEGCIIARTIETKCLMKYTVLKLVRQIGVPGEKHAKKLGIKKKPKLTKQFILDQLHLGKTLVQIAEENGLNRTTVTFWSHSVYGINARLERKI